MTWFGDCAKTICRGYDRIVYDALTCNSEIVTIESARCVYVERKFVLTFASYGWGILE